MAVKVSCILALDIGSKRIGIASADSSVRIASPLVTIPNDKDTMRTINELAGSHQAEALVIGLPRNLSGESTQQTREVEAFVAVLKQHTTLPLYWQDEALTSKLAEAELNVKRKTYAKADIDSLAATYILDDFLQNHQKVQA